MPTVTVADLVGARAEGRAIGAFTTYNLETTLALRDAAEATGLPVIVQVDAGGFQHVDRATLLGVVRAACLELGCSSVTFDGSCLPFEENVELTRAAVALGRRAGAWVEGELGPATGHLDRSLDERGHRDTPGALDAMGTPEMTDPARAAEFAARTGVDALAVRVGAVDGAAGTGRPDLDRLAAIAAAVPVPLVLRDASGLTDDLLRAAISRGVAKITVDAALRRSAFTGLDATLTAARDGGHDLRTLLNSARRTVAVAAADRARLFGLPGA